jgi:predicted RNase H-like nuclease (RuvC/YqgF family)
MKELKALSKKIYALRFELAKLEAQFDEKRLEALREVTVTHRGMTVTLTYGNRAVKAKKMGAYSRWKVWEGDKVLISDYAGGNLHDIRFLLASGQI